MEENIKLRLEEITERLERGNRNMLGYPVALDFNYEEISYFYNYMINNIGDPYEANTNVSETHDLEQELIQFFAKLLRADEDNYWGYITNGGSESNLYGLYISRELYPKAMVYYSESTHYSVNKNIHLLNIPSIVIRSQENGEMDYDDLYNTLQFNRHRPAIVLTTFGTTMTEAKDDISEVATILKKLAIHDHHIHCDAALSGAYGHFIEPRVPFDMADGADSIAISGHKFIGSPFPCGIVLTKKNLRDRIAKGVSYIGSSDTTITGSRNGHGPILLWYAIQKMGIEGLRTRYLECLRISDYCLAALQNLGIPAWKNPGAITVVLPKVSKQIRSKWQIATSDEVSHVICMPGVTKEKIDEFIKDVASSDVVQEKLSS